MEEPGLSELPQLGCRKVQNSRVLEMVCTTLSWQLETGFGRILPVENILPFEDDKQLVIFFDMGILLQNLRKNS